MTVTVANVTMDETVDAVDATVVTDETATMMRDETVDEPVDKAATVDRAIMGVHDDSTSGSSRAP